jgi:hypothetical protein
MWSYTNLSDYIEHIYILLFKGPGTIIESVTASYMVIADKHR